MEEHEEQGMDTTYIGIMVVVFLVVVGLAIDIGYMYVSEDDLHNAAELSAMAGAQVIGQQIQQAAATGPEKLKQVLQDPIQAAARTAATSHSSEHHAAAALIEVRNGNSNHYSGDNDLTVGFWNVSSHVYTPGGTPVNAVQVRTRRTAEGESAGLGTLGTFLAKMTGSYRPNYTPESIAAIPAQADANIAVCAESCGAGCTYPNICTIAERKMTQEPGAPATSLFAYTTLTHPPGDTMSLSNLVCSGMPAMEVCGKDIYTIWDRSDDALRDLESVMYNPNQDKANKDYDKKTGALLGWWVIAPVTDCPPAKQEKIYERHRVTKYALIRISRICVPGKTGCSQSNTAFDAPAAKCAGSSGLYIDRISCLGCNSPIMSRFPGLHPVLVK